MKKVLLKSLLALGILFAGPMSSYAENPPIEKAEIEQARSEKPDMILVVIENGVIVDIVIIKNR